MAWGDFVQGVASGHNRMTTVPATDKTVTFANNCTSGNTIILQVFLQSAGRAVPCTAPSDSLGTIYNLAAFSSADNLADHTIITYVGYLTSSGANTVTMPFSDSQVQPNSTCQGAWEISGKLELMQVGNATSTEGYEAGQSCGISYSKKVAVAYVSGFMYNGGGTWTASADPGAQWDNYEQARMTSGMTSGAGSGIGCQMVHCWYGPFSDYRSHWDAVTHYAITGAAVGGHNYTLFFCDPDARGRPLPEAAITALALFNKSVQNSVGTGVTTKTISWTGAATAGDIGFCFIKLNFDATGLVSLSGPTWTKIGEHYATNEGNYYGAFICTMTAITSFVVSWDGSSRTINAAFGCLPSTDASNTVIGDYNFTDEPYSDSFGLGYTGAVGGIPGPGGVALQTEMAAAYNPDSTNGVLMWVMFSEANVNNSNTIDPAGWTGGQEWGPLSGSIDVTSYTQALSIVTNTVARAYRIVGPNGWRPAVSDMIQSDHDTGNSCGFWWIFVTGSGSFPSSDNDQWGWAR